MSTPAALTPTSYAVLGLLAVQPWSTYELAQQMDRTLNRFWPRARSKLYEEPKKLVAHGLARASEETVGRRPRTVYAITPRGRWALSAWLGTGSAGPVLESEHLLKVFFCESGSTEDLRATLADLRAWAHGLTLTNVEVGEAYLEGRGPFPQRAAVNQLVGRFLDDLLETVDGWAAWAEDVVARWPEDPASAVPDLEQLASTVARSSARAERYLSSGTTAAARSRA
jgi:DNA-binding PadR family transcriptional regulator